MDEDPESVSIPGEEDWCDLWHTHVDWQGAGNHGIQERREFLNQLLRLFLAVETHTESWTKPKQQWVVIHENDSREDAVYLHTWNPNRDNYPYAFDGVEWNTDLPGWLDGLIDIQAYECGRRCVDGETTYWIRRRHIG